MRPDKKPAPPSQPDARTGPSAPRQGQRDHTTQRDHTVRGQNAGKRYYTGQPHHPSREDWRPRSDGTTKQAQEPAPRDGGSPATPGDPSRQEPEDPQAALRRLPMPKSTVPTSGAARRLAAQAAAESPTSAVPVEESDTRARLQVLIESRAIWCALLGGLFGIGFGLVVFPGERPALAGDFSIQFYSSIVGGMTAGVAFVLGFLLNTRMANVWLGQRPKARQLLDTVALLVVHSAIAVMACLGLFRVFQEAFVGLTVDYVAGAVMLAVVGGAAAYFSFNSGARVNSFSLSTLLAVFMASGVLVSMLFAENPLWWHFMFSELGTGHAGATSFWTFNTTLVVSGVIITTLTAFIARDLEIWAEYAKQRHAEKIRRRTEQRRTKRGRVPVRTKVANALSRHAFTPRIGAVRVLLVGMGITLAGVGLVPINVHHDGHTVITAAFGLLFFILLTGMPYWLPGFPRTFYLLSYLSVAGLVFATVLWIPIGYYNLTAMELIGAAILFAWLVIFIRNIAALSVQAQRKIGLKQDGAGQ